MGNAFLYKKFSNYLNCFAANCVVNDYSFNKLLLAYAFNFENEGIDDATGTWCVKFLIQNLFASFVLS